MALIVCPKGTFDKLRERCRRFFALIADLSVDRMKNLVL